MNLKSILLTGLAAFGVSSLASAQTIINITGATAFRAGAHNAILAILDDGTPGSTKYCWVGSAGTNGFLNSNRIIAEGTIGGAPFIIRTNQNGSTQGVKSVVLQTTPPNFNYLDVAATAADRVVGGQNLTSDAGKTVAGVIARFAFSDVDQALSETPTPALPGAPVGVVPFVFISNVGADAKSAVPGALNNMTDQLHEAQWSLGELPLSMYTGNPADSTKKVLNTGRNNGSGTRATILAETRYGAFTNVVQWGGPNSTGNISGSEGTGTVNTLSNLGNGGYSSNSFVRQNLARTTDAVSLDGGAPESIVLVSYLTLSDASVVTNITGNTGVGCRALNYNGFAYSEENVKNGQYSLWGYQQFYGSVDITAGEQTFFNAFTAAIPATLDPIVTGIPISEMNVTRFGGDGGIILP
ncbi:MAG: hypothetical protein JNK37_22310 [Verrucomicrobiales bacterium]|nr:hypothetical protein [Verrucomicrobiales bacterium]